MVGQAGIGVFKKAHARRRGADFLAFFTNPANSAKLAAVLPAAAQLAAHRRRRWPRPTRCSSPTSCRRSSIDGIANGVVKPSHTGAGRAARRPSAPALDPLWTARRGRQGRAGRRLREDPAAAGAVVAATHGSRRPRWAGSAPPPRAAAAAVLDQSPPRPAGRIPVRHPAAGSAASLFVLAAARAWWSGTACTSGTCSPTPSSSSARENYAAAARRPEPAGVLRATGLFSVGLVVLNLGLALLLAVLLNQRLRGHHRVPHAVLLAGRGLAGRLDDRVGLPAPGQRRHQRPARRSAWTGRTGCAARAPRCCR